MEEVVIKMLQKADALQLMTRGVSYNDLPPKGTNLKVMQALMKIEPSIPGVAAKSVTPSRQASDLARYMRNILKHTTSMCISSHPTDLKAKWLASYLMRLAIEEYNETRPVRRTLPLWHKVYGSFGDPLRDDSRRQTPSLLVISNIVIDSTPLKIEKVRDLIELYDNIPKIVVTGGPPPCDLFANKLHLPLGLGIYLGSESRIRTI
jgi:hypothetical protein